jgi:hypothetical protein
LTHACPVVVEKNEAQCLRAGKKGVSTMLC